MTVANFLNFSRAAEVLRITQPAVSHQINALENELGVKLFHRTSKSVRLTQAGYLFTQYADEILRISGLSKERLKAAQEVHSVRLGVGCRNFVDLRLMIPTLSQLATEEPLLLPLLRMTPFDSLENLLEEGDIIQINIPELTLNVKLSEEELAARKAKWQPREPKITSGYLARYAAMVTSGNRGAVLEVPGKNS